MKNHHTQCDSCVFKIIESQAGLEDDKVTEQKYKILRDLKIAPKRAISVSFGVPRTEQTDKTETCFLQSKIYPSKIKSEPCPDRIDSASGLTFESALSLRSSSAANRIAREASRWAMWAAIIAIIAAIIAVAT